MKKINLPNIDPRRMAAIGISAIVLIIVIWVAVKLFRGKKDPLLDSVVSQLQPQNLTLSPFEYEAIANRLQNELYEWGFFQGPDVDDLLEIFSPLQTRDDFLMLVKAFGIRKNERYVLGSWEGDLFFWFSRRLGTREMEAVKQEFARVGLSI